MIFLICFHNISWDTNHEGIIFSAKPQNTLNNLDTSSSRDEAITLGDVMGDQVLDSTMDNAKDRALSMDNVSSMMRSPVADADNEGYGSYDELD